MDKLVTTACGLGPNFFLSACDAILARKSPEKTILAKGSESILSTKNSDNKKQKI
ncbi:hypothetical protein SAMN02910357_01313 [Succinivibrio dextrinosolvens]|uniref:hypothetical protein n=1 Tax=Succinivibrio dextrinosolvens TaxID=83771 RepID=UPI0008E62B77|nr:hypothetical protein [Succinivibrio dextrinosolvens]SFS62968.1 hypothetical protein SAMN02910357_01313 [Succinivibrio dextrinosolvens]